MMSIGTERVSKFLGGHFFRSGFAGSISGVYGFSRFSRIGFRHHFFHRFSGFGWTGPPHQGRIDRRFSPLLTVILAPALTFATFAIAIALTFLRLRGLSFSIFTHLSGTG